MIKNKENSINFIKTLDFSFKKLYKYKKGKTKESRVVMKCTEVINKFNNTKTVENAETLGAVHTHTHTPYIAF